MYSLYFMIGFLSSFGWWSAGKVQKAIDNTMTTVTVEHKEVKEKKDE